MSKRLDNGVEEPSVKDVWDQAPSLDFAAMRSLKRELLEELRAPSDPGERPTAEDVLHRWPTNPESDPDVASVLFEDFVQRRTRGEEPSLREYEARFPQHANSLAQIFEHQGVLRSVGASCPSGSTLSLPAVGDELFHFRLCYELGRGAFARVFLAEQAELAGRPVVLKVSGITGNEPQTLAQLQHTYIVPIYSVHEDAKAGLRAVCMPYFGGASLSHVLQPLWEKGQSPTQGDQLIESLDAVGSQSQIPDALPKEPREPPAHELLRTASYICASAWIVARLAEALQHAHQRGVLHRDIKPSNILLGADGQPMLLDFNLSQNMAGDRASATLGGTVSYMAPEHLRAMASRDAALARLVDQRADIYSLGMVLYEMLAGQGPFQQSGSYSLLPVMIEAMALERSKSLPSVRQRRQDVPWSLESIVQKCLAPDMDDRYQQAEQVAEDLQAFLTDQPLRHAPELSQVERVQKWVRRHPRLTSAGMVATAALVLLAAAGAGLLALRSHLAQTNEQLTVAEARQRKQEFEEGVVRAFCLINTTVDLPDQAASPRGAEFLRQGLSTCEQTLGLYGVLDNADWRNAPAWQHLDPDDRRRLAEDVRELLLLLAAGRMEAWQRDPARTVSQEEVLRSGLDLLDRAEAIPDLPASPALELDRAYYLQLLGEAEGAQAAARKASSTPPASARDHYLLALAHTRNRPSDDAEARLRGVRAALIELDRALILNNKHYWTWLQRGLCHLELGEPALAAGDFGVCVGLWPEQAWGYFNRAIAWERLGKTADAQADYSAALQRDAEFALAYLNRGVARLELQRNQEALADLDHAAERGYDEAFLHVGRGVALERLGRHPEADAAFDSASTRLNRVPEAARVRLRWVYGFAVAARLPVQAKAAFQAILKDDPQHLQALYGMAMLAAEEDRIDDAIDYFNQALHFSPNYLDARRFRAVLLARRGDFEAAERDINICLEREPNAGITLYAAACVIARALKDADVLNARVRAAQALEFLEKALDAGYGQEKAATDPDLALLRKRPEFKKLMQSRTEKATNKQ